MKQGLKVEKEFRDEWATRCNSERIFLVISINFIARFTI